MLFSDVEINFLAVIVVAIIHMAIGAFWYSPAGFGKKWMHLMGITMEDMGKHKDAAMRGYIIAFVASLIMAYVFAGFIDYTVADTFGTGAETGFWLWLGFIAPVVLSGFLWERRPFQLFLINVSYYLVSLLIGGGILAVWK